MTRQTNPAHAERLAFLATKTEPPRTRGCRDYPAVALHARRSASDNTCVPICYARYGWLLRLRRRTVKPKPSPVAAEALGK